MSVVAIEARGLGKDYLVGERRGRHGTLRDTIAATVRHRGRRRATGPTHTALDDLSFAVHEGETVGFIGHNGAGKSTLLKILSRITHPSRGTVDIRGRVGALLEVGTGFHPELTGRENVYLNGAILGMTRGDISSRFDDIVEFSGVQRFLDTPVKHYSSGMTVRLAFSVAAHIDPEVLLIDEVLAVGDAAFQRRCLDRLATLATEGRTILFVSHNMSVIQGLCRRGILLESGRLLADGPMAQTIASYMETLERATATPLAERTDRQGNGPCRIQSVEVRGPGGGPPATGAPLAIEVRFSPSAPSLDCAMTIFDAYALPLASFGTAQRSPADGFAEEPTLFRCEIDPLLLKPGRYRLDVGLHSGPEWHDAVHSAMSFDVEHGLVDDRPPALSDLGDVLLPHAWSVPNA